MTFLLLLLYISLTYIRPWEFLPALEPFRLAFVAGNLALAAATVRFIIWGPYVIARMRETHLFFAFTTILVMSRVLAMGWVGGAVEAFLSFSPAFITAILIYVTVDSLRKLRVVAACLLLCSFGLIAMSTVSYYTGWQEEKFVMQQGTGEQDEAGERIMLKRARATGSLNDPNDFAQALLAALPLLLPVWRPRSPIRNTALVIVPGMCILGAVYLTHSRGAILAVLFMITMHMREKMMARYRILALLAPVMIAAAGAAALLVMGGSGGREISTDDESAAGRMMAWRAGFQMLRAHPITGVGFGRFSEHNGLAAHNSYVNCFAELGFPGYLVWIALLVSLYISLKAITRIEPSDKEDESLVRWGRAIQLSFYGLLATAFFLSRTYAPAFYTVVGLVIALQVIAWHRHGGTLPTPSLTRLAMLTGSIAVGSVMFVWVFVTISGF